MKRIFAATLFSLTLVTVVCAQQPQPVAEGVLIKQQIMQGPEGGPLPPPPPSANFVFMASESFGGKIVKGAPYSAEAVTETIQTLGDGNRIVNRITSQMYRDSDGRTRREQSFKGLGIFGAGEEPSTTIFINDPVAGVTFSLDTRSHTAVKSLPFRFELKPGAGGTLEGQKFEFKLGGPEGAGTSQNVVITGAPGPPALAGTRMPHAEMELRTQAAGAATYIYRTQQRPNLNEVKEQLGKQIIEGVEAEGTRTTVTIPAGEIGNERPIESVSESWYSPELQLVVMTRNSDPRFGETTFKLTNINRTEPAKSLFEVPAGFTVKEAPQFGPGTAPMLPRKKVATPEE